MKKNTPNMSKLPANAKRMLHPGLGIRAWLINGHWYRSRADYAGGKQLMTEGIQIEKPVVMDEDLPAEVAA